MIHGPSDPLTNELGLLVRAAKGTLLQKVGSAKRTKVRRAKKTKCKSDIAGSSEKATDAVARGRGVYTYYSQCARPGVAKLFAR
jgi:hypothetical protein